MAVFALAAVACVSFPEFFVAQTDAARVSDGGTPLFPTDAGFDADDALVDTSNGDFLFFVTSRTYPSDFGADGGPLMAGTHRCSDVAKSAGLQGSFRPFLWQNTTTDPMSVVPTPFRERVEGLRYHQVFSDGGAGLVVFAYERGSVERRANLILNESGFMNPTKVWTGGNVLEGGTATCNGWSNARPDAGLNGGVGHTHADNLYDWDYYNETSCGSEECALYCIQVAH